MAWERLEDSTTRSDLPLRRHEMSTFPSQDEVHAWSLRNFGPAPQVQRTLGLAEEVGEVCRAVLKRHEGYRGTAEEWATELRKEMGDCVIKLLDIAAFEGFDLGEAASERWGKVSQRDWIANPIGHGIGGNS